MATEGYLEKGLELDLTQLCPRQAILEEVGETVQRIEVKIAHMHVEGGFQASCSTAPLPARLWPRPGLTGVGLEGTEMRKTWSDESTRRALPLASVRGFWRAGGRLRPNARDRAGHLSLSAPLIYANRG